MKRMIKSYKTIVICLLAAVLSACSLDVTDPNTATDEEVLNSREGIISFTTGMQGYVKGTALQAFIRTPAVTTREFAINTTFANLVDLEAGGTSLPDDNADILQNWSRLLQVVDMTSQIIESVDDVQLADDERSEILAISHIYKAMALGYLVSNFEQSPINTEEDGTAESLDRSSVLAEAISLLNAADDVISATPPSTNFRTQGLEFENTIQALLARYHIMSGNYDEAIEAADNVDLGSESIFFYDGSTSRNPIYDDVFVSEAYAARSMLGSDLTDEDDGRLDFFLVEADETSTPNNLDIDMLAGFFGSSDSSIPIYRPGEMMLIRAEAYARTNRFDQAVDEINEVRTKTSDDDIYGIGADLPEYDGPLTEEALIEEVYRQRRAELFLTGLSMEDMRRLDRPDVPGSPALTDERNRNFYPYPEQERQTNPNTPSNPDI